MIKDCNYRNFSKNHSFIDHDMGDNVHIIDDIYAFSLLARLSSEDTLQPYINYYLRELYKILLDQTVSLLFPRKVMPIKTRMLPLHEKGIFEGEVIDPETKVLITDIARAGIIPGQICFDTLNYYLNPENVVFDHIMASRDINIEDKTVNTVLAGMKVTPEFSDGYILLPDPMGASGSSMSKIISLYREKHHNIKIISMNLIITPEYVRRLQQDHPDVHIVALRYDRGLSSDVALENKMGAAGEVSLTESRYIIPGAGGLGEIINNNDV